MFEHKGELLTFIQELVASAQHVRSSKELNALDHYQKSKNQIASLFGSHEMYQPNTIKAFDKDHITITAWNIERGMAFDGIVDALLNHEALKRSDVLLLTEVDFGMARSQNRMVAKELCEKLNMFGLYSPAYINLDLGNGAEQNIKGQNSFSLQGHAILSRFEISKPSIAYLPNAKDHMKGPERQIGQESAIVAGISTPMGLLHASPVHLAAHSSRLQRQRQMLEVLKAFKTINEPSIIGGDWNTNTYNAHKAVHAILGFWRRVAMGINNMIQNHYPHPQRYFEKGLFNMLEQHGFYFDELNVPGECTLHYDFNDPFVRKSLEDWLPKWCFKYVDWSLKKSNGVCSFKLDWFAGKKLQCLNARVIHDLPKGQHRCSDHDPIMIDVRF